MLRYYIKYFNVRIFAYFIDFVQSAYLQIWSIFFCIL